MDILERKMIYYSKRFSEFIKERKVLGTPRNIITKHVNRKSSILKHNKNKLS
jgi:predicted RNA binding protein with dsRBD fold (UPF0201 family)